MKKILKRIIFTIISILLVLVIVGLILAYLPVKSKTNHVGITPEVAATLRQQFTGPHDLSWIYCT